ncbi:hypothetical protein J7413_13710 [Shimia sp. R10_1]|uniref:I78 family peptidase inhibitor n=1 Tax=Shimia sp. R10_1 TaxID=2821095 RepID=UPI001ADAEDCA|nr:I78 family peptidase inhibitor [Shimia sp. R10_1]MBO9474602.1 hypothetical protein [Shimia sp. R10_1]
MRMMGLMALCLTALVACKGDETVSLGSTKCDPDAFAFLIGQDKSALEGVTTPEVVRVLGENSAATMDFVQERLNVVHDESGKIVKITCG